jgi:hypothetical protein
MTPAERRLRGQIGAHVLHATGKTTTTAARAAFNARFYEGIPGDLPQAERDRRAAHARAAHFKRLALASARKRARR